MVEKVPSMHKAQDSDPSTENRTIKIKCRQYETITGEIPQLHWVVIEIKEGLKMCRILWNIHLFCRSD